MALRIQTAESLGGTRLAVSFNDGRVGYAELSPLLKGPIFEELLKPERFAQFRLDPELGTVVWPNGADLAPEAIYFQAFHAKPELQELFQRWGYSSRCNQR